MVSINILIFTLNVALFYLLGSTLYIYWIFTNIYWILLLLLLSFQLCLSLHNPIDSNPPGSSVPRILQARTLEWVAIYFCIIGY